MYHISTSVVEVQGTKHLAIMVVFRFTYQQKLQGLYSPSGVFGTVWILIHTLSTKRFILVREPPRERKAGTPGGGAVFLARHYNV